MIDGNLSLLIKYPLISTKNRNGRIHYNGRVMCGSHDTDLHVIEEKINGNVTFTLKTTFGPEINEKIAKSESQNIVDFLDNIVTLLARTPQNHANSYKRVLHEYFEFTRFHLNIRNSHISSDLQLIKVTTVDEGRREHRLEISVDLDEVRDVFQPLNVELPEHFVKALGGKFSNLTEIYRRFLGVLEELQPFFDVMDEVDGNCGVLDPETPTRGHCHRRIWLDQNLSVIVTIDPLNVRARPELRFFGPERLVHQHLDELNEKLEEWNDRGDFLEELLKILSLEKFPQKPKTDRDVLMDVGECCICFSLRLDEKMPEIICGNKSCENFFHVQCLYEWLSSVNSKRILNQIHGQCPNCEKEISCPLPDDNAVT
ncbi:E3 ubiquitin-protein ligase FANCL-like Protein [Tribolium castaneum]|uniref:E3 ubiquitin-protein ligase FANCL-like Protein n=2 Tax=Tribolium castaneum TaxID=7070 RepID=D2A687_TRICA|nr:E3 ubiquitin-protein ligase FANCL-like Protein [Tribolium castaneum]